MTPATPRTFLGYEALIRRFGLRVPPLRSVCSIGDKSVEIRSTGPDGSESIELPVGRVQNTDSLVVQLTFALKREHLNLTVFGALCEHEEVLQAIQAWLVGMPRSKYARFAAHLVEWLSDHRFDYRLPPGAPREALLAPDDYVVGPPRSDAKFGVINNLLGDAWFSPLIRRTDKLQALLAENLAAKVTEAVSAIEPEMLARAVDYLYLEETQSTYRIEDEVPDNNRKARFRLLLEQAGQPGPLTEQQLCDWQNQIVSAYMAESQFRDGQNWLARPGRLRNVASFIPPPPDAVEPMMEGVAKVAELAKSGELDPLLGATCAAFGLVFVHPFFDGNGRLHRFLLHHILRQTGFTPAGVVLPLSARMLKQMDRYSSLLKSYSRPRTELLEYALDADSGTIHVRTPQPKWLYAYFDATDLCEFIFECCRACVEEDLQTEIEYLRAHDATVEDLGGWLDMRQAELNTLINVIVQGHGVLSKSKQKLVEKLKPDAVDRIVATVNRHFADYIDRQSPV